VRRRAPRPLSAALGDVTRESTPATLLARVQAVWAEAVGVVVAAQAQPVSERAGTLTVECRSAVWAGELELLAPELLQKLNAALGDASDRPLRRLRARVGRAA
jgi:predicted nucleic acid-binding Zn ribbon protein